MEPLFLQVKTCYTTSSVLRRTAFTLMWQRWGPTTFLPIGKNPGWSTSLLRFDTHVQTYAMLAHTTTLDNVWRLSSSVVSSMSSLTPWTEEGIHPDGRTYEVWNPGLYHPPGPLLQSKYKHHVWAATVRMVPYILLLTVSSFVFSTTFMLIPPRLSLTALLFMNMKDIIQPMASWSS